MYKGSTPPDVSDDGTKEHGTVASAVVAVGCEGGSHSRMRTLNLKTTTSIMHFEPVSSSEDVKLLTLQHKKGFP